VPHVRGGAVATAAELRRGVAWRASDAMHCVHRLVLPLELAKEEEGIQTRLKRSYLRVSYHPLRW
jgi:hypothetical protein